MEHLKEIARRIASYLYTCRVGDPTDNSGYYTVKEFLNGTSRKVDVYKSDFGGIPHYAIECCYENGYHNTRYTGNLSQEQLLDELEEFYKEDYKKEEAKEAKEDKKGETHLKDIAHYIVEYLRGCGFNDITDSSGYYDIKEFADGTSRAVDVYKSNFSGVSHYVICCSYEDDSHDFKYTDDLSEGQLLNKLEEFYKEGEEDEENKEDKKGETRMTNAEKYKTPRERHAAFIKFCEANNDGDSCKNCPLYSKTTGIANAGIYCDFLWLDLEADNDTPTSSELIKNLTERVNALYPKFAHSNELSFDKDDIKFIIGLRDEIKDVWAKQDEEDEKDNESQKIDGKSKSKPSIPPRPMYKPSRSDRPDKPDKHVWLESELQDMKDKLDLICNSQSSCFECELRVNNTNNLTTCAVVKLSAWIDDYISNIKDSKNNQNN